MPTKFHNTLESAIVLEPITMQLGPQMNVGSLNQTTNKLIITHLSNLECPGKMKYILTFTLQTNLKIRIKFNIRHKNG